MKICIFGGAFDPIHNGHIKIAQTAIEYYKFDKLIFMVSKKPPHKSKHVADFNHRYNMVNIITDKYDFFDVTDIENKSDNLSYTYNSLIEIKKIYENDEIYFLVGSDIFATIETWYKHNELFNYANFIVGYRPGLPLKNMMDKIPDNIKQRILDSNNIELLQLDSIDISSSFVRNNIKKAKEFIPDDVYKYIELNNLYNINEE